MDNYIEKVSKNINIEEGDEYIESLLKEIYIGRCRSNKDLAKALKLPIPLISATKKEFIKLDILTQDKGIKLTKLGEKYVEDDLKYKGLNKDLYIKLMDSKIPLGELLNDTLIKLEEILDNRPSVDITIDQTHCTSLTSLKRAIFCLKSNSLIGKKIICIGDDDLVSISLGFLINELFKDSKDKAEILVVDIDDRYLEYIEKISKEFNLNIKCKNIDLRLKMDEELLNRFDCFFTDPPYTLNGLELFLKRGLEALRLRKGLSIFLSFGHKSPDFTFDMIKLFLELNIVPVEIIKGFNEYKGAGIIGGEGQLIHLKTISKTDHNYGEKAFKENIYTGEILNRGRVYICKSCGAKYEVGINKDIKTIAELKSSRCKNCNCDKFDVENKDFNINIL